MSRSQRWRFALQIIDGPNAGLGVGSWRLWTHKNEIYVAAADQTSTIKVSLHDSGRWRVAYVEEHMREDRPMWDRKIDRAPWKFMATPFVDGVQQAFVVATVRAALRPCEPDRRETLVPVLDSWEHLTGVMVLVTEPHIDLTGDLVFSEPLRLDNGRLVWMSRFVEQIEEVVPTPIPGGQLARVLTPEEDSVICPGLLLVAVNVT